MTATEKFQGKVAYVTGAGSGMGESTARFLAQSGAAVALIGRRADRVEAVAREIEASGGKALALQADVSRIDEVEKSVRATVDHFGALHYAVNNAGISGPHTSLVDLDPQDWESVIGVNLFGIFYGLKYQIPAILASGGGAIVNVSSVFADRGFAGRAAYSTAKHGIRGLTRSAALEFATSPIRINELQPGMISTEMISAESASADKVKAKIPSGRIGDGREIATTVAFLLSDEASYINGAHLAVDDGLLA